MRTYFFLILLQLFHWGISYGYDGEKKPATICFFALNNEDEFTALKNFTDKIQSKDNPQVQIIPIHSKGADPRESFRKMVEDVNNNKMKCDGLVISGHHTGAYAGNLANGSLDLGFIEELSCDKNSKFFSNLKSVWLNGCRTLGDRIVTQSNGQDVSRRAQDSTLAVAAQNQASGLQTSMAILDGQYSEVLDKDNPISDRYLRIFPRASVLGWDGTAPSELGKSSILFHIAQLAMILDEDKKQYFTHPEAGDLSEETAVSYLNALLLMLEREDYIPDGCPDRTQRKVVDAWKKHATGSCKDTKDVCMQNPYSDAFASTDLQNREGNERANQLGCELNSSTIDDAKRREVIEEILSSDLNIGVNYNNLINMLKTENKSSKDSLYSILRESEIFQKFLENKFNPEAGNSIAILTKLRYLKTYNNIYDSDFSSVQLDKIVEETLATLNDYDRNKAFLNEYKIEVLKSLVELDVDIYNRLIKKLKVNNKNKEQVRILKANIISAMAKIPDSEKSRSYLRSVVSDSSSTHKETTQAANLLLRKYVNQQQYISEVFNVALNKVGANSNYISDLYKITKSLEPKYLEDIFESILNNKETSRDTLFQMGADLYRLDFDTQMKIRLKLGEKLFGN